MQWDGYDYHEERDKSSRILYVMHDSLFSPRKLASSLTLCCFVFSLYSVSATPLSIQTPPITVEQTLEPVSFEDRASQETVLLANHGGEAGGATGVTATTAAPLLGTIQGHVAVGNASDSLWGNLLLGMAYQRDPEIQALAKKMGRVNTFTLLSVAGVSALGLAQSINSLSNANAQTVDVHQDGHDDHQGHVTIPEDSKTPATLGIIGSSATLLTLGVRAILNKRYTNRLDQRQNTIKNQIENILARLEEGHSLESVQSELTNLVGPRATREFSRLWQNALPRAE